MWDSGIVATDESTNVQYEGAVLAPDQTYYWKVRVWDQDGNVSEWSETATFSTAIPDADDQWEGEWIGADLNPIESPEGHSNEVPPDPLLRKKFTLDKEILKARLHISGLGFNEPYLNGERVGDNVLDPAITDYEETVLFTSYDVTEFLQQGENAIGVALGRGRFGEPLENTWFWDDTPWWDDPQLLVQLNVTYADDSTASIMSDDAWRATDGPTRYDSLFDGEEYDARKEQPGWTEPTFDDADWDTATVVNEPEGELKPQRVQPVRTHETVTPVSRSNPEDEVFVFDMGVMVAGWTRLTVNGPEGSEVRITMGEKLNDDGTVHHSWSPGYPESIQEDTYILSGEGTETWESSFTYKGFRYVQIEGFPGTPTTENVEGIFAYTDLESGNDSDFACSNDLLNQIHENTRRALLNNHHGVPTDTPVYEKNGWTGDAQATAATAMYNFDMARFYQKWLRDLRDAQLDSGEVPTIVPTSDWSYENTPGWGAVKGPTPGWDATYFIVPWLMYQFNGDERVLQKHYKPMKQYLEWFEGYFDGYIPEMGLGDWVSPGENEVPIVATAYYYRELDIISKVASVLGHSSEASTYEEKKRAVMDAFNERFYDPQTGSYGTNEVDTYVQTSNVLPLAFGMVPDERVDTVVDALVSDIVEEHDGHLYTGLFGTKHILPVLSEYGHHDLAYTVATQTTYPSWGHWIENGMTALLESWPLDARSRDHHFLGTIDEWFYQYLAGVRKPADPGFEHVKIAPKPVADLDTASGRVDTVRGQIQSRWEQTKDGFELAVTIPWNTTATIQVPTLDSESVRVTESGMTIWADGTATDSYPDGVTAVERTDDAVSIEVGAGDYEFTLE
ncbi:alpha-L-rhamnosidase [Natrinema gelatinilyticum]|uniref:alpha-L-rhamnosidase n=1 Tax=Natrinema gelatinilyticum TaxID=2961571 RepID=UPI0020C24D14|nr:alpha-L-rhamnosidase [Natrinema gelatinilyticum]